MVKVIANDIRVGNIVEHQGKLWTVLKTEHVKPGKGGAFCQMEMKALKFGTKLNERFRSSESLEQVRLDQKDYQYLYTEGKFLVLMDTESYEQINVDADLLGDDTVFLQDGMMVTVESSDTEIISIALPQNVVLEIVEAEAVVKGQTAASSNKPAILENGVRIMVPPFIGSGEKVVVDTRTREYVERAK